MMVFVRLVIAVLVIVVDRITKQWALTLSGAYPITSWLSFSTTFNHGISWGMLQAHDAFHKVSIMIGIVMVMALVVWYGQRYAYGFMQGVGITLILSGAFSNLIDRIMYGAVVDFIEISYYQWIWPNFNIADAAIVCGVILIIVYDFFNGCNNSSIPSRETI